jgi:hypothetical protein
MGDHPVGAFIGVSTFHSCTEDASTSFAGLVYGKVRVVTVCNSGPFAFQLLEV